MNILQIIVGLILALFLPGYLMARTFFKELSELEKLALGFVLSICLDIFLGLFLGYNETMKNITGGITAFNLWLYLIIITVALLINYIIWNKKEVIAIMDYLSGEREHHQTTHKPLYQQSVQHPVQPRPAHHPSQKPQPQKTIIKTPDNKRILITKYSEFIKRREEEARQKKN